MKNFIKRIFESKKQNKLPSEDDLKKNFESKKQNKPLSEDDLKKDIENLHINNCKLPESLILRFKNDKWQEPLDKANLLKLVIQNCPFEEEIKHLEERINEFTIYCLQLMKNESESLDKLLLPEWDKHRIMFLGKKDGIIYPGDIDTKKVIFFADLGWGSDTAFGLDYREPENNPSVILMYWGDNPETDNRWKKIANSFAEFEQIIWEEK